MSAKRWLTGCTSRRSMALIRPAVTWTRRPALDSVAEGFSITSVTIIRHRDGSREFLPGTSAAFVEAYREGNTP